MEVVKAPTIPLSSPIHHDSLETHQQLIARIDILHDALKTEIEYTRRFLEQIHAYNARPISMPAADNSNNNNVKQESATSSRDDDYASLRSATPSNNRANTSQKRSHHPSSPENDTMTKGSHNHPPFPPQQQPGPQSPLTTSLIYCKCCQQRLASEERELWNLEKKVRGLEGRVKGFEEMPSDKKKAWMEVEKMKRQLRGLMSKRGRLFKELVEENGGLG